MIFFLYFVAVVVVFFCVNNKCYYNNICESLNYMLNIGCLLSFIDFADAVYLGHDSVKSSWWDVEVVENNARVQHSSLRHRCSSDIC